MKIVKGNLLTLADEGEFDVIIHGCNCFCAMASGIAFQIANKYPSAHRIDNTTRKGDVNKLSNWTLARVGSLFVVNLYTQYKPGADFILGALEVGLYKFRMTFAGFGEELRVGVPWIGCGIGGGNKEEVADLLRKFSLYCDLTIVEYEEKE